MKKSTKALSAILSLSSVASVVAPVTAMAATVSSVDTLLATAAKTHTFADYHKALKEWNKLSTADQNKLAAKLVAVYNAVPQITEISKLINDQVAIGTLANATDFWANYNAINATVKNATDKAYLINELAGWGVKLLDKVPGYTAATDAINAASAKLAAKDVEGTKAAIAAAQTKIAAVTHVANKDFLTKTLKSDVQDKLDALVASQTLKVEAVTATNLKELVIKFSKAVDETTAETVGNIAISGGTTAVLGTPVLQDDKMTVIVPLATPAVQQETVTLTVKNVKDANGTAITETSQSVKFFDSAVPSVTGIEVTGPKTVKVSFSEPINSTVIASTTNFSVDNNTYSVASVTGTAGNKFVTVTLGSSLPAGTHSLTVNATGTNADPALKDYAGFWIPKSSVNFVYAEDKTAPTVSLVSASQNQVKIKFSKAIDVATQGYLSVYHTYNNNAAYVGTPSWDADNQTVTVTFAGNYLPIGNATVYVNAGTSPNLLKDGWGNAFASTSFTNNISADTTKPTVTKVEVVDSTHLDVTFSEAVSGANTVANYALKDSSDTTVNISSAAVQTGNTYRLTTSTLNGGSYKLTVKDVIDTSVAQNKMDAYTTTLSVNDLVKPTVTTTGVYSTDLKKVVVNFSEQMATTGTYSVLDKANYQVNFAGSWVDLSSITGASVALNNGGKGVTITFPTAQALTAGDQVRVARVADLAGNVTAAFTTDVTLGADDVVLANISNAKAIAANKVQFEVNTTLSGIDVSKFNIQVGGANKTATAATYVNDSNKAIVTITVADADKFATDLTGSLDNVEFAAGGLTTTLGTSNSGTVTVTAIDDYVAPAITGYATKDIDKDGKIDAVDVTFSEALYVASVQESDFTVEGYEVNGISTASNVVTISVKELSGFDTNATPKVTLVGAVSDNSAQRNSLGAQAAVVATDNAGPAIVGIDVSGTSVTLTFSENVDDATVATTDFTLGGTGISTETISAIAASTANDNVVVLTLSAAPTLTTGKTVTIALGAGSVKDRATVQVASTQTAAVTYTK